MNRLLAILLGVLLSLIHIAAGTANTTEALTTTAYTYTTLPDVTEIINTDEEEECAWEFTSTLNDGEGLTLTICGYEDDEGVKQVGISLDLPHDRWVGVGFSTQDTFVATNPMKDAYAFIFPWNSRNFTVQSMTGEGQVGDELIQTFVLNADLSEDGRRIVSITRKALVTIDDIDADPTMVDKYFDFGNFENAQCGTEIHILYAFGKTEHQQFAAGVDGYHGENAGVVSAKPDVIKGSPCFEDAVNRVSVIGALIVSMIAMLL
eukprot:20827_1